MSVLQRKAQVGKQEHQARAMTVPKALRVGIAKVADEVFDLALAVIGVAQEKCTNDNLGDKIDEQTLMLLLDGPSGGIGAAMMDASLVTALVQQQTTGRVGAAGMSERRMTATDAALCAPVLDAIFTRAHNLLETDKEKEILNRYKFGSRAENKRLFQLALEEPEYNLIKLTIDVAGGTCQSMLTLILPVPAPQPEVKVSETGEEVRAQAPTLAAATMALKVDLSAQLCRFHLPLSRMSNLQPGEIITLPTEVFDSVELTSIDGRIVAKGALGQVDGRRALMLSSGVASDAGEGMAQQTFDPSDFSDGADYADLDLPELELPNAPEIIKAGADGLIGDLPDLPDIEGLPDLPDLPDLDNIGVEADGESFDLPDLPDLPDLGDDADFGDLPKLNIA
ncbi:MAG: FliM/FliN family flagellar motor C-terminal domain-containing protein [Roseobacter sp.]